MKPFLSYVFWPIFFVCQLISLALLSWHLAAQWHFAYPVGYKLLDLETHIAQYAPLNRNKAEFEHTTPEDHWRLFGEITDAVQDGGRGLQRISYTLRNGQSTGLMHEAEIIHLQDVANLIDIFYQTGLICMALWLVFVALAAWKKWSPPSNKKVFTGFMVTIGLATLGILIIGPTAVFYWLHVKIFPPGHQWFFYYQDSLMTTLMEAPDIFAFISVFLLVMLIFFWCLALVGVRKIIHYRLKIKK